jgi:hypothetical protein
MFTKWFSWKLKKVNSKTEFEKIGVNVIRPFKKNDRWVFTHNNTNYDLAPAGITDVCLSPLVIGVDRLIALGCNLKKINNPEEGFDLLFSEQYFPNADVKFNFKEEKFDGWIYDVEELNLKGLLPGQAAWICPYMRFYYQEIPRTLYLKVEKNG